MLQRDYLIEAIVRFVETLARALRRAVEQQDEAACHEAERAVAELLELEPETISALAPNGLVQIMELSGMGRSVCAYAGYALDRVADIYEDLGNDTLAELRRAQAEAIEEAFGRDLSQVPDELDELDLELFG